jgi:hypothetical protein
MDSLMHDAKKESVNLAPGHHAALLFFFSEKFKFKDSKKSKKIPGVDNNW